MAPAHEDVASGGRRRGRRRNLSWGTLLCFGSQEALAEETTTPWERSRSRRRKKRTVPVDGDLLLLGTAAAASEVMRRGSGTDEEESPKRKGLRLPGCCFLAPARAPGRKHSTMDGRSKRRHLERTESPPPPRRSQSDKNSTSEALSPRSQIHATGGSNSNSNGSRPRGAEQPRGAPAETTRAPTTPIKPGAGVGAFGPVVGLSVVVAVSMAGLLGGRLWAVACVCAWLAALSRLRRSQATTAAGADSTDHKKPVVLRGLLERDRRKAVSA